MVSCYACGYTQNRGNINKGITFHRFPNDKSRRGAWLKFVNGNACDLKKNSRLCSQHFTSDAFDRTSLSYVRLWHTAIPAIHVSNSNKKRKIRTSTSRLNQTSHSTIGRSTAAPDVQTVASESIEGNKQKMSLPNDSLYIYLDNTYELSVNSNNETVIDLKGVQVREAVTNIVKELNGISCNDSNTARSAQLKSDVLAIVFCYLQEVGTYFDYIDEEANKDDRVDEDNGDIYCLEELLTSNLHNDDVCNESQSEDKYYRNADEKVVRHTCPDCGLSLSTASFLASHLPLCFSRYSNDSSLSYWDRLECPKCNKKYKNRNGLKYHILRHKIDDYNKLLTLEIFKERGRLSPSSIDSTDGPTLAPAENMNSDYEDNASNMSGKTSSDRDQTELKKNDVGSIVFREIFDSSKPDGDFNVTFVENSINDSTADLKPVEEYKENSCNMCEFCDEEFSSTNELKMHKEYQHRRRGHQYVCNYCPQSYSKFFSLLDHTKMLHNNVIAVDGKDVYLRENGKEIGIFPTSIYFTTFKCSYCKKLCVSKKEHKLHEGRHLTKKLRMLKKNVGEDSEMPDKASEYVCEICGKSNLTYRAFSRHKYFKHSKFIPAECPKCLKTFKHKLSLRVHMHHRHSQTCMCDICGAVYNSLQAFKRHMMCHTNIRKFKCELCPKTFMERGGVNRHLLMHTKEKKFVCRICDKRFRTKMYLAAHINGHMGVKPFKCPQCNRAFRMKKNLNAHMATLKFRHGKCAEEENNVSQLCTSPQ